MAFGSTCEKRLSVMLRARDISPRIDDCSTRAICSVLPFVSSNHSTSAYKVRLQDCNQFTRRRDWRRKGTTPTCQTCDRGSPTPSTISNQKPKTQLLY